jgi:prophage regulatory protein
VKPITGENLLRIKAAMARTGHTRSTFYNRIRAGAIPPGVPIGPRCKAWPESEIEAYVRMCIDTRDAAIKRMQGGA